MQLCPTCKGEGVMRFRAEEVSGFFNVYGWTLQRDPVTLRVVSGVRTCLTCDGQEIVPHPTSVPVVPRKVPA